MADVEVVIKMPEEVHKSIINGKNYISYQEYVEEAIKNGIPLPKGHGKVGDITELQKIFHNLCDAYGIDNLSFISDMNMNFDLTLTWVEADKGDEE